MSIRRLLLALCIGLIMAGACRANEKSLALLRLAEKALNNFLTHQEGTPDQAWAEQALFQNLHRPLDLEDPQVVQHLERIRQIRAPEDHALNQCWSCDVILGLVDWNIRIASSLDALLLLEPLLESNWFTQEEHQKLRATFEERKVLLQFRIIEAERRRGEKRKPAQSIWSLTASSNPELDGGASTFQ